MIAVRPLLVMALLVVALVSLSSNADAQFVFTMSDADVDYDFDSGELVDDMGDAIDDFDLTMSILDEGAPTSDTEGFQCGVTYDAEFLNLEEVVAAGALDDLDPAFFGPNLDPAGVPVGLGGMTLGVVYDLMGDDTLAFDDEEDVATFTFTAEEDALAGLDSVETTVNYDATLGDPVIDNSVVVDGDAIEADTEDGTVTLTGVVLVIDGAFGFFMDSTEVGYADDGTVADDINIVISIQENDANPGFPSDTEGFQMGLTYDTDFLADLSDAVATDEVADLNDGDGPSFFGTNFDPAGVPAGSGGFTLGVVYDLMGMQLIDYEDEKNVVTLTFDENADTLADEDGTVTTEITWDDELGAPELPNVVVVDLVNQDADIADTGVVDFVPGDDDGPDFINGDALDDGVINNLDAFFIIHYLFIAGSDEPNCFDAADANDDAEIDNVDTLLILNWVYTEGPAPDAPFPDCGSVDTFDIGCEESACP